MTSVLGVAAGVLPVFLFLGALLLIDSYKLVALRAVLCRSPPGWSPASPATG